jgi:hypothetical protein
MGNSVIIEADRSKITLLFLGSLIFVSFSLVMIFASSLFRFNQLVTLTVGIIALLLFGFSSLYLLYKILVDKKGLEITRDGITDHVSAITVGEVKWEDIEGFEKKKVGILEEIITVYLKNPEEYLKSLPVHKKNILKANHKLYGSPVQLASTGLKCSTDELLSTLEQAYSRYRK